MGLADGTVEFWQNVGTASDPQFGTGSLLQVGQPGSKSAINVGGIASVDITDWNDDGRPDLVVGGLDGRMHVFLNRASEGIPDFRTDQIVQAGGSDLVVPSGRARVVLDMSSQLSGMVLQAGP